MLVLLPDESHVASAGLFRPSTHAAHHEGNRRVLDITAYRLLRKAQAVRLTCSRPLSAKRHLNAT
jgi:hypothetical protein